MPASFYLQYLYEVHVAKISPRLRNDRSWSGSMMWFNSGHTSQPMYPANGCAAINSSGGQDPPPLLPLLCVCIYQILWTYIFFLGALHGIRSVLPIADRKQKASNKNKWHSLLNEIYQDLFPEVDTRPFVSVVKRHRIVRNDCFDKILSRTLASHIELAMKGFLLFPACSGLFAPIFILVVPRSTLLDVLTPEAFACITFRERLRAHSANSHALPICVPWTSPSLRQHIIAKVLDNFQCMPSGDPFHLSPRCYTPRSTRTIGIGPDNHESLGIVDLSNTVRSRAGNPSPDSPGQLKSAASSKPSNRRTSSNAGRTRALPVHNRKLQGTSDDDEEKKKDTKKRRISGHPHATPNRLPCIYHVCDPDTYTRGPRWKHCNPQTTQYPDPSALS